MQTVAVVLDEPGRIRLSRLPLAAPGDTDVLVDVAWSGISAGTERLLWSGWMPRFPGMGYPLVPGYETVGTISAAGPSAGARVGDVVFVPGAQCFGGVRGLFGAAASRLVVPGARVLTLDPRTGEQGTLLALAATAQHAIAAPGALLPELIVGHGVLGRLLARLTLAAGAPPPTVWETVRSRRDETGEYPVLHPDDDSRRDYQVIYDASGNAALLDTLVSRLGRGGEIVLAGFYADPLSFAFPPAFMREARLRVAAEWQRPDLLAVRDLVSSGRLSLGGLISHRSDAAAAETAYRTAFDDPDCLKMTLDWRAVQ